MLILLIKQLKELIILFGVQLLDLIPEANVLLLVCIQHIIQTLNMLTMIDHDRPVNHYITRGGI